MLLLLAGALLRAPFLFDHGIDDDEFYTLRNSVELLSSPTPSAVKSWPVLFGVVRGLSELFGPTPFALRLFPVLCGILAPAFLFLLGRRLIGERAALLAALLLVCWPWHQYFSGVARYYAPTFLLGLLVIDRLHLAITRGRLKDGVVAVALLALAALTHATGLLAAGGGLLLFCTRLASMRLRVRLVLIGGVAGLAAVVMFVPAFSEPVLRVVSGEGGLGYDAIYFLMSLIFNVSPLLLGLGLLGVAALLKGRSDSALYLSAAVSLPIVVLGVLATLGVGVQARYAMAALPALLLLSGAGLERLLKPLLSGVPGVPGGKEHSGRLVLQRGALVLAVLLPFFPSLASNLIDGNRHDVPGVARYLEGRLQQGQMLFAESHSLLAYYLYGYDRWLPPGEGQPPFPRVFGESPPSPAQLDTLRASGVRAHFVIPENVSELLPALGADGRALDRFLRDRAVIEYRLGQRRLDYHRNVLTVYRAGRRGSS